MDNANLFSSLNQRKKIRAPVVSGIFYPQSPQALTERISFLLDKAEIQSPYPFSAIICPHGSLEYSGDIAAFAWKSVSRMNIDTIVIITPSHHCFENGIFLPESEYFAIPGSEMQVDKKAIKALLHCSSAYVKNDLPHLEEHGIEAILPFAAHLFPDAALIPIIAACSDISSLITLFNCLNTILESRLTRTLFVLSSNMAVSDTDEATVQMTKDFTSALLGLENSAIAEFSHHEPSFCGAGIVSAFLQSSCNTGKPPVLLGSRTSKLMTEADEPVVGYAAFGFPV